MAELRNAASDQAAPVLLLWGDRNLIEHDEDANQMELVIIYDPEDADAAIVELDRLHAQLISG